MQQLHLPIQALTIKPAEEHPPGTLIFMRSRTSQHQSPTFAVRFDECRDKDVTRHLLFMTMSPFGPAHPNIRVTDLSDGWDRQLVVGCGPDCEVRLDVEVDPTSLRAESSQNCAAPYACAYAEGMRLVAVADFGFRSRALYRINPNTWMREEGVHQQQFAVFERWRLCLHIPAHDDPLFLSPQRE